MRATRIVALKSRPTFAVVVDGECEVWYLQMLKRNERSIVVNIEPKIPQKKSIHDQFQIVIKLADEYTKVFWIVDFDVIIDQSRKTKKGFRSPLQLFLQYRQEINNKYENIVIIVNNPCIEFWILLHFQSTSKYFDSCGEAEKQLKKHLSDYQKTKNYYTKEGTDIYLRLRPSLSIAIQNAKKLGRFQADATQAGISEMQLFFEAKEFKGYFKVS